MDTNDTAAVPVEDTPDIIVEVRGGLVVAVWAAKLPCTVRVIDWDNFEEYTVDEDTDDEDDEVELTDYERYDDWIANMHEVF